jgi:hypothetical protein
MLLLNLKRGFGPQITQMEGFRRYTAAKTGNASTVNECI